MSLEPRIQRPRAQYQVQLDLEKYLVQLDKSRNTTFVIITMVQRSVGMGNVAERQVLCNG